LPDFKQAAEEKAPKKSASSVISKKKKKESTAANTSALSKSNDTTRDNSFSNSSFDRQQQPQFNVVHKDYSENFLQQDEMVEAKQEMRRSKTKHASGVSSGRKSNVQDDKECTIF
jgi:hypothetical protein